MKKKGIFLIGLLSILSVNAQEAEQPASNWKKGDRKSVV